MTLRPAALALLLPLIGLAPAACKNQQVAETEVPAPPAAVSDLDGFEASYNDYVLLREGDPQRAAYRTVLLGYLYEYLDDAYGRKDDQEALSALQYALALFTPHELRTAGPMPGLARRADAVYGLVARRGAEQPSLLCLAVAQHFGDEALRTSSVKHWKLVEQWLVRNGPYSTEPLLRHEELERVLEQVSSVFPSPFVVEQLADLYVSRYDTARTQGSSRRVVSSAAMRRMQITGYLLLRLHLRADDFEGAVASLSRVELDMPVAKLGEMTEEAMKPRRSALPLLTLAEQFAPEPGAEPGDPYTVQGWGIVNNLSRRAVIQYPKDAYAHLLRARALANAGLTGAAVHHLRRSLDLKEDVFDAWQALAELQQELLATQANADPQLAVRTLADVEAMHTRAAELWTDRPVRPGLPEAFYTVAEGLYQAGDVDQSEALLARSLVIQPVPDSIDLLGTISLKRSKLGSAREHYENLASLAYEDELSQLRWEARARQQLGEIEMRNGDAAAATKHLRIALRHNNDLLARTASGPSARAERYVERGKLLFTLGDTRAAMTDFRKAAELSPASVKVYADPLRIAVAHGYYDEARDVFRRAMAQTGLSNNLKLYFSLWMYELALRQGLKPEADAMAYLESYEGNDWGETLSAHARGSMSFERMLERAKGRGEQAEAYFYEGLKRWRDGDPPGAKAMMTEVINTQMMGFFEFDMAQRYLRWGELPTVARLPLPAQVSVAPSPSG